MIAEAIMAATLLCTAGKKTCDPTVRYAVSWGTSQSALEVASGPSLESRLKMDLKHIPGVKAFDVTRTADYVRVDVVMETLEFSTFEGVVQKELEYSERFPRHNFQFSISAASEADA
jgi:hypothetical protein